MYQDLWTFTLEGIDIYTLILYWSRDYIFKILGSCINNFNDCENPIILNHLQLKVVGAPNVASEKGRSNCVHPGH